MQFWALIVDSFRHTRDRKIFWVMIGISVLIAVAMSLISFDDSGLTLFFKWRLDNPEYRVGHPLQRSWVVYIVIYLLTDKYIGLAGIVLGLIATSGLFPALMEPGAVDVVLAKPMSRAKLFLAKYLGGMSFVLVQSAVFVGLTFLVAGVRWKQWLWPYLWSIPLSVVLFSYVYVFCTFFSVRMRSGLAPLILGLACWFGFFVVQSAYTAIHFLPFKENKTLMTAVSAARWAVPRTQDISHIAARLIDRDIADKIMRPSMQSVPPAGLGEEDDLEARAIEMGKEAMSFDMMASLASSLGIETVVLLLAMWRFSRRDF